MKTNFLRMASNMILGLTKTALIVALAVATPMLTACTKDNTDNKETPKPKPTPTPEAGFTYTGGDQTCTAAESTISFSFSTPIRLTSWSSLLPSSLLQAVHSTLQ